jgi:Xaa-Pro aminopeptidase
MHASFDLAPVLRARRAALTHALAGHAVLLSAGSAPGRNYAQNPYIFRASSHVLHLVGSAPAGSFLWLLNDAATLFVPASSPLDALWHGAPPDLETLSEARGLAVLPLDRLGPALRGHHVATIRPVRLDDAVTLAALLGRPLDRLGAEARDLCLADALVRSRLTHDAFACHELRRAAAATVLAHRTGMGHTRTGIYEYHVKAAMEHALAQENLGTAYPSIVTTRGEVLHNHDHGHALHAGDLLLADVGGETHSGYAADVTRTWPVSGRFSGTQRALYDAVLASQRAAIACVRPGVRYRDVHLAAARELTTHLVDLGLLEGAVDALVEDGVHALFMPHGIGHLLGLDVHDMEDLGDQAGYAAGRTRSAQFGLGYLRLDRDLIPGMLVTIEPGFYQVPLLLQYPERFGIDARPLRRERLAEFSDVRGIRIEDDVLVTEDGHAVLTERLPKDADAVEALVRGE